MQLGEIILGLAVVIAYISFIAVWGIFATRRLVPWLRQKMGEQLGVTIVERYRGRSIAWEIREKHSWQQGCLVSIGEFFTTFGCLVGPMFCGLGAIITIMILLSGE